MTQIPMSRRFAQLLDEMASRTVVYRRLSWRQRVRRAWIMRSPLELLEAYSFETVAPEGGYGVRLTSYHAPAPAIDLSRPPF